VLGCSCTSAVLCFFLREPSQRAKKTFSEGWCGSDRRDNNKTLLQFLVDQESGKDSSFLFSPTWDLLLLLLRIPTLINLFQNLPIHRWCVLPIYLCRCFRVLEKDRPTQLAHFPSHRHYLPTLLPRFVTCFFERSIFILFYRLCTSKKRD